MENNELAIIIVFVILVLLFGSFGMMGFGYRTGMMSWMFGAGFGFMLIFMILIPILTLLALVIFIIFIIKKLQEKK